MLSTLMSAPVPAGDAELMRTLDRELDLIVGDGTETLFRFAISNDAGELYRVVLVFGFRKRQRALELMGEMGYQDGGPRPARHLDAVFLPTQRVAAE